MAIQGGTGHRRQHQPDRDLRPGRQRQSLARRDQRRQLPRANLFGGDGNDTLTGGSGNDLLFGQAGQRHPAGQGRQRSAVRRRRQRRPDRRHRQRPGVRRGRQRPDDLEPGRRQRPQSRAATASTPSRSTAATAPRPSPSPPTAPASASTAPTRPRSPSTSARPRTWSSMLNGGDDVVHGRQRPRHADRAHRGRRRGQRHHHRRRRQRRAASAATATTSIDRRPRQRRGLDWAPATTPSSGTPATAATPSKARAAPTRLLFNGSNVNENIDLSANGSRVRFTRDVGNVTMDCQRHRAGRRQRPGRRRQRHGRRPDRHRRQPGRTSTSSGSAGQRHRRRRRPTPSSSTAPTARTDLRSRAAGTSFDASAGLPAHRGGRAAPKGPTTQLVVDALGGNDIVNAVGPACRRGSS